MRPLLLSGLLGLTLVAPPASAADHPATILVVPFTKYASTPDWMPFAIAETMTDLVAQQNRDNFLSLKVLDAVLRRRDLSLSDVSDPEVVLPIARSLGATDIILGDVRNLNGKYIVTARRLVVGSKEKPAEATETFPLKDTAGAIAKVAQKLLGIPATITTATNSEKAFEASMKCSLDVIKLPLGPRAPAEIRLSTPDEAEAACRVALAADPNYPIARAALALVLAAKGDFAGAKAESALSMKGRFSPHAVLVHSALARYSKDDAGARSILQAAVKDHPGFLHALGYLAEDRMEEKDWAGAVAAWDAYLARSPDHPWALGQKGKALAQLGKLDDAIAISKHALELNPGDPEAIIELASRYIDANHDPEAELVLRDALLAYPVRPVALLRMGYVCLRQKRFTEAREWLGRTLLEASREDEARTRGLAHVDLAMIAALEGKPDDAIRHLEDARAEGSPKKLPCDAPQFVSLKDVTAFTKVCGGAK